MLSKALRSKAFLAQPTTARAFGHKIKVANPVVDMDGDEMTKIIWKWIKERVSYLPMPKYRHQKLSVISKIEITISELKSNQSIYTSAHLPIPRS